MSGGSLITRFSPLFFHHRFQPIADITHIQDRSFLLSQTSLEILSQTDPEECLLGDSKSSQVDGEDKPPKALTPGCH